MLPTYKEFLKNSKFEYNHYENEVRFELYENGEFVEHVMDTSLDDAIHFFKDNFEGDYIIKFENNKFRITL